jgi:DNA repair protein RadC
MANRGWRGVYGHVSRGLLSVYRFPQSKFGGNSKSLIPVIITDTKYMTYLQKSKITIEGSQHVAKVFLDLLALEDKIDQEKEHFYVMHLDIRSRVKMVELVSLGILDSSLVHPRETFRRAIVAGSASIIVAHNHPSGEVEPSDADTKTTNLLFEAGKILGITLLDHIIFVNDKFFSFRENKVGEITKGSRFEKGESHE